MAIINLCILLLILFRTEDDLHIFQQNSYRAKRYLKWRFETPARIVRPHEIIFLIGFVLTLFNIIWLSLLGLALMTLDVYFHWLIKTAYPVKKKLAYTPRVNRLKVTMTLILALMAMAGFTFKGIIYVSALSYFMSFIYVLIADFLNRPIESRINTHFFEDAQKELKKAPNLVTIGITGSYGKTSTKNVLNHMLSKDFNVLMTPESFNTKMGLTRTLREGLKPIHDIFIAEMGAKEVGDIKELCDFVHPTIGIITSIGPQHLETFKTLDNVILTKGELFASIPAGGKIFVNCDDENILKLPMPQGVTAFRYAVSDENAKAHDVHFAIDSLKMGGEGSTFNLIWAPDGLNQTAKPHRIFLKTKLLGRHNLSNVVAGCAVALSLGVLPERLAVMLSGLEPIEHRLSQRQTAGAYTILDDAFNSNPIGSRMALEVLKAFDGNQKIIITPGMVELGEEEEALNMRFGEYIADACDRVILVGAKQTEPIQRGLKAKNFPDFNIIIVKSIHEAYARLQDFVAPGDVVLLENDLPDAYNEKL